MHSWIRRMIIAAVALAMGAAAAHAQPAQSPQGTRQGVHFGFGIGGGQMSCESTNDICDATLDEAGGIDLHVGGMINPRLSLQGDVWVMFHTEDRVTISHSITTFAAQYWLFPRLWVKGGVGFAIARAVYDGPLIMLEDETKAVPGIMLNAGYELIAGQSFALDVQLKFGTGFYDDDNIRAHNTALVVGFNWY